MSNLKQIGLAIYFYAEDWNDWIVPLSVAAGDDRGWINLLNVYLKQDMTVDARPTMWKCPSDRTRSGFADYHTYGYNSYLGPEVTPGLWWTASAWEGQLKLSQIRYPSQLMIVCDGYWRLPGFDGQHSQYRRDYIHNGGVNQLFVDGHVKWLDVNWWISKENCDNSFWMWHRD